MQSLNNLDVVILVITAISALIALYRGLVKEVLSIIGWVLASILIFYLLPILTPVAKNYIENTIMASIITTLVILIVFYIIWLFSTDALIGKVRSSKLSKLDRMLGLLFGVIRACLIVILFNILISWVLPEEVDDGIFKESKYFTLAGEFAKPIELLIPDETKDLIKVNKSDDKNKKNEKKETITKEDTKTSVEELFEKLASPKIEKTGDKEEKFEGYKENQTDNLDRLIEATVE